MIFFHQFMQKMRGSFKAVFGCFALVLCVLLSSCMTNANTESHGAENIAYLQIASSQYSKVEVILDGGEGFVAKTNDSAKRATTYEHTYKIAVGAHDVVIKADGEVIFSKKIFASSGEVKIVEVQ